MSDAANDTDSYLATLPAADRAALQKLRTAIKAAAPEAVETVAYAMPAFKYRGRPLAYFAAFKDHCSFFPTSFDAEAFAADLAPYRISKGTIQFKPGKPLPAALVRKLVRARMADIDARAVERQAKPQKESHGRKKQ